MSSLMRTIRDYPVEKGAVALWWFGQNGYILKTPAGTLVGVDLYLTNSCEALGKPDGLNLARRVPILIEPEDLELDLFACTHDHQDHADPETISRLRHKDTMMFLGPQPTCQTYARLGIESGRIVPTWPKNEVEFRDVTIRGTFALPTDTTDLNHMGFVLKFSGGPGIYITGDTDFTELLYEAAAHKPDLMITCINGGFNNLSHWEAAKLAGVVRPKAAVPCHYDMFADNALDPKQFAAALKQQKQDVRYVEMTHAAPLIFSPSR